MDSTFHKTVDTWKVYFHLPHDTEWSIESYKNVYNLNTVEHLVMLFDNIQESFVKKCMIFVMKNEIKPVWEDENNMNGNCIAYKIDNESIFSIWKDVCCKIICNNVSKKKSVYDKINGITISPKTSFSILKIWMRDTSITRSSELDLLTCVNHNTAIIKKHK